MGAGKRPVDTTTERGRPCDVRIYSPPALSADALSDGLVARRRQRRDGWHLFAGDDVAAEQGGDTMSPTVEAWFTARDIKLTPLGEVAVIAAAGLGMLLMTGVTVIAIIALGTGVTS